MKLKHLFFMISLLCLTEVASAQQSSYDVKLVDGQPTVVETTTSAIPTSSAYLNEEMGKIDEQIKQLMERRLLLSKLLPLVLAMEAKTGTDAQVAPPPATSTGN